MDFNYSYFSVEMSSEAFAAVNVPVSVFSVILNIMFVFCMVFPLNGTESLKQPLTVLLALLVGCNLAAHICILVMVFNNFFPSYVVWYLAPVIAVYIMLTSVNSSHWLNVCYCFQIIPVQRPYLIWLRRNIRIFMYPALIINAVVCLLGMSVNIAGTEINLNYNTTGQTTDWTKLRIAWKAGFWMTLSLFCLSLCVMLASCCVTVVFLWRHMKNMEMSRGSSSHRQRQITATIISIAVQAVLHVVCSALVVIDLIIIDISPWYFDMKCNMLCTVISLYSFGTSINMACSQSLFRQRAVRVWQKLFRPHTSSVTTVTRTVASDILSN